MIYFGTIVIIYITNPELKVLIVENTKTGNISFVGGASQGKETLKETAIREIKEEISVDVQVKDLVKTEFVHEFKYGPSKPERYGSKGQNTVFLLELKNAEDPKITSEIKNFEWVKPYEALDRIRFEDLKEIIQKVFLKYNFSIKQ